MIARSVHVPLLIALAFVLYLPRLGMVDIMPPDEPRYAQVAREMLQSGDFLVPTLNGEPYKEKPPLMFWLAAGLGSMGGDVGPWAARLPSALSAIAILLLTYVLARSMFGPETGFLAALVLLTTTRFWWEAGTGQLDMLLTACVTTAIVALWQWHTTKSLTALVIFYIALGAGLLAKGPPALVFPLLLAVAFYWGRPAERRALRLPLGLAATTMIFLLWLVPARLAVMGKHTAEGSEASAAGELFKQTLGRLLLGVSKAEWPWFYIEHLPADLLPWTLLLPWAGWAAWRARKRDDAMRFLWAWFLPSFVFFTVSVAKRQGYLLPLYPCMAMLLAVGMREAVAGMGEIGRKRLTLFWAALLGAAALTPWLIVEDMRTVLGTGATFVWCGVLLGCCLDGFRRAASGRTNAMAWMFAWHTAIVLAVAAPFLLPALNAKHSVRGFCAPIAAAAARGEDFDLYSVALFREELRYHANHPQIVVLMHPLEVPGADTLRGLKAQAELRSKLRKAMGEFPWDSWPAVRDADQKRLAKALSDFLEVSPDRKAADQLLTALRRELDEFLAQFGGERAALYMMEERDFRWLCAIEPRFQSWRAAAEHVVGGNRLLLFANARGRALIWQPASSERETSTSDICIYQISGNTK